MRYFDSHFVFAYILKCSRLTKLLSVWTSAMPKETEYIKQKLNTLKRGIAKWLPDYMGFFKFLKSGGPPPLGGPKPSPPPTHKSQILEHFLIGFWEMWPPSFL